MLQLWLKYALFLTGYMVTNGTIRQIETLTLYNLLKISEFLNLLCGCLGSLILQSCRIVRLTIPFKVLGVN